MAKMLFRIFANSRKLLQYIFMSGGPTATLIQFTSSYTWATQYPRRSASVSTVSKSPVSAVPILLLQGASRSFGSSTRCLWGPAEVEEHARRGSEAPRPALPAVAWPARRRRGLEKPAPSDHPPAAGPVDGPRLPECLPAHNTVPRLSV